MKFLLISLLLAMPLAAQERISSDFEIATATRRLNAATSPLQRVAAHMNLGDLRASRLEINLSRGHYEAAVEAATEASVKARESSAFDSYAEAMAWTGFALAKLGRVEDSFLTMEEALRYHAAVPRAWNLYASTMTALEQFSKAESAARRAVALSKAQNPRTPEDLLDLHIYQYNLVSAILRNDPVSVEAENLLLELLDSLTGPRFEKIRRRVSETETFEVFSLVRADEDAFVSLRNRAGLRLARLYENRGNASAARAAYRRALEHRDDDPVALAGLARLSSGEDRSRWFAESFAANPFSPALILDYEEEVAAEDREPQGEEIGTLVRRTIWLLERGRPRDAAEALAKGQAGWNSSALDYLEARIALAEGRLDRASQIRDRLQSVPELERRLFAAFENVIADRAAVTDLLTKNAGGVIEAPQAEMLRSLLAALNDISSITAIRPLLDDVTFRSRTRFDEPSSITADATVLSSGTIQGVPFRFSVPTAFRGRIAGGEHTMVYRVAGAAGTTLIIEPSRIDP